MHMKSYDRADGETAKAYGAFTIYRNMGANRSLDRTALEFYSTPETPQKHPRNITQIEVWSRTWNWVCRCKDFDRDEEAIARERKRELDRAEHDLKLEQFRIQNETMGFELLDLGKELLAIFSPIIATLTDKEVLDKQDIDLLLAIPSSIKALAAFSVQGSSLAADGLLIRQLMEKLKEGEIG
jgi:hypothetical protein